MQTLKFSLIESKLKNAPGVYLAKPVQSNSLTLDDLVESMLKRSTSLSQTDIVAVLDLFVKECEEQIANGHPLNLPLFNGLPIVGGTFTGPEDSFDPARHTVRYKLSPGTGISKATKRIVPEKVDYKDPMPFVSQFYDVVTQTVNSVITSMGIGEISGSRLQFNMADNEQGIFFIDREGKSFRVEAVAHNQAFKLIFQSPKLPAGEYTIEVRVRLKKSTQLKTVAFTKQLTVKAGDRGQN